MERGGSITKQSYKVMMILISMVFLMTGCGSKDKVDHSIEKEIDVDANAININDIVIEEEIEDDKVEIKDENTVYPEWTKSKEADQQIYDNLNLDGVGDADDSIYISTYQWGTQDKGIVVLQTKLGTGEVLAITYDEYDIPSILIGRLQYENKESIVVQLMNRTSNYLSTKYSILEVIPAQNGEYAELVERLRFSEESEAKSNVTKFTPYPVTYGAEITDLEDSKLQGLNVPIIDSNNRENFLYVMVHWKENEWVIGEPSD